MSLTFNDIVASDLENIFLNSNEFGGLESVSFVPIATGTARTIQVYVIDHTIHPRDRDETQEEMQRIEVMIWRDQADATKGGATTVYRGDTILRAAGEDPAQVPFAYAGEQLYMDANYRRLIFQRPKLLTLGTN